MLAYVGVPKIWGRFVRLQVPHKFRCAPVPLLSEIWGHVPPPALWRRRLWIWDFYRPQLPFLSPDGRQSQKHWRTLNVAVYSEKDTVYGAKRRLFLSPRYGCETMTKRVHGRTENICCAGGINSFAETHLLLYRKLTCPIRCPTKCERCWKASYSGKSAIE